MSIYIPYTLEIEERWAKLEEFLFFWWPILNCALSWKPFWASLIKVALYTTFNHTGPEDVTTGSNISVKYSEEKKLCLRGSFKDRGISDRNRQSSSYCLRGSKLQKTDSIKLHMKDSFRTQMSLPWQLVIEMLDFVFWTYLTPRRCF